MFETFLAIFLLNYSVINLTTKLLSLNGRSKLHRQCDLYTNMHIMFRLHLQQHRWDKKVTQLWASWTSLKVLIWNIVVRLKPTKFFFYIYMWQKHKQINSHVCSEPILTVRRCFLRMYMMKPHILDVTPRKVRMPSKHCRVFSMLMSTQRPHSKSTLTLNS